MSPTTGEVLLRLRCHGHPAIRATHGKTFEFATGSDITGRATCVMGVGATVEQQAAPVLAGPVRLRLDAGGDAVVVVTATANPHWQPGQGMIVRRSGNRLPDTLATDADNGAGGLPRDFAARLRDPGRELRVTVECAPGRATLVLLALADRPELLPRLLAEAAAADAIVAEDAGARAVLRAHGFAAGEPVSHHTAPARRGRQREAGGLPGALRPPRLAAGRSGPARPSGHGSPGPSGPGPELPWPAGILAAGGRVLVAAAEELPGRSALALLASPGEFAVEVAGLPSALTVASASPSRAPVLMLDGASPRELRGLVRDAPPATRLVFRAPAAELPGLCRAAGGARPLALVTAARAAAPFAEQVMRLPPEEIAGRFPAGERLVCCLDAVPAPAGAGEEAFRALAAALAREQVSTRTLAKALAEVPGWSRNRAYEFVAAVTAGTGQAP